MALTPETHYQVKFLYPSPHLNSDINNQTPTIVAIGKCYLLVLYFYYSISYLGIMLEYDGKNFYQREKVYQGGFISDKSGFSQFYDCRLVDVYTVGLATLCGKY
jgi:hypothetical protein